MKKLPFHKLTLDRKIYRFLQANGPQTIDIHSETGYSFITSSPR